MPTQGHDWGRASHHPQRTLQPPEAEQGGLAGDHGSRQQVVLRVRVAGVTQEGV